MIRLRSEDRIITCAMCGENWTGAADGHCTICTSEFFPSAINWFRVGTVAALVLGGLLLWWTS